MSLKSFAVIGVVALAIGGVTAGSVLAGQSSPTHYIAMGDSVAAGQGATVEDQFGYVGLFNRFYRVDHRGAERQAGLAVPGETSSSLAGDQLSRAVEVINNEDTNVEVVTVTIGGNDFLPLIRTEPCATNPAGSACQQVVAETLGEFAGNYQGILTVLSTALASDPGDERVLVTTYYNPFDGTGSPFDAPTDGILLGIDGKIDCAANSADPRNAGINDLITCIGSAFGATAVDIYPLFSDKALALTHIGEGDIHPNDDGYEIIAEAVIAAYNSQ